MSADELLQLAARLPELPWWAVPSVALLAVLALGFTARWLRRHDRPDQPLMNLAMVVGLGWSSEAVWEITGRAGFPLGLRLAIFAVLEIMLIISMIRVRRTLSERGGPGRAGRTVWTVAAAMAAVGLFTAEHGPAEGTLRAAVPLLLTWLWWGGVVPEDAAKDEESTSWRWTPRRLLLWLGAIEPGARDVETVHRERLTQRLVRLERRRQRGAGWLRGWRESRIERLSELADDDMIAEVRRRVARSRWFDADGTGDDAGAVERRDEQRPTPMPRRAIPASRAASARAARARHRSLRRKVCATHPVKVVVAAQEPFQDPRATTERDLVIRVIKQAKPGLTNVDVARLAVTSEPTVRRALRRNQNPSPPPRVNGRRPELEGVDR